MKKKRAAFTLVELLVVIAIIGIMVGMLMPAVQAARESARVVQCQNHLKQIALACQNYEAIYKEMPGYGGETWPVFVTHEQPRNPEPDSHFASSSWIGQILPQLEQGPLAAELEGLAYHEIVTPTESVHHAVSVPVETLACPSRRDAKPYPLLEPYRSRYGVSGARTDYAMSGGPALVSPTDELRIHVQHDGVWQLGKRTKLNRIRDGLSYTYLVGEKAMDVLRYESGDCFGDRSPLVGWSDMWMSSHSYVRYASRSPQIDQINNCLVCHDFGSAHPAGWNVANVDGSVTMMGFSLDMELHRAHASMDGRDEIEYEH